MGWDEVDGTQSSDARVSSRERVLTMEAEQILEADKRQQCQIVDATEVRAR